MELRSFHPTDEESIRRTLAAESWTLEQIEGQLQVIREMAKSDTGLVAVAENEDRFSGFLSAQLYSWNRLIQIHGLAVVPGSRGQGIGSLLLGAAARFARVTGARGVYVDTPVDNEAARAFYNANGYAAAYEMPRYYSDELDGVTYTNFFG
jgi:ribosomal protein S18 acetylase RimI-like enzyme